MLFQSNSDDKRKDRLIRQMHLAAEEKKQQEAQANEEKRQQEEKKQRNEDKKIVLSNPRWIHTEQSVKDQRPDSVQIDDKIKLIVDQQNGEGKTLSFNILDLQMPTSVDPERLVKEIQIKIDSPSPEVEWTVKDPRTKNDADRDVDLIFHAICNEESTENCDIPFVENYENIDIDLLEIPDILYNLNSAVPCINKEMVIVNTLCTALKFISENSDKEVVVIGHTDKSGDESFNLTLSEQRAKAVKAIIDNDPDLFVEAVKDFYCIKDIQIILNTLNNNYGWTCDAGKEDNVNGNQTKDAIKLFQLEYNFRYDESLTDDGVVGPKTLKAVFDVIYGIINDTFQKSNNSAKLPQPVYGYDGKGIHGCGSRYPANEVNLKYYSRESRRVEIALYDKGNSPVFSKDECSVFNSKKSTLNLLEVEEIEIEDVTPSIAFFFDGTDKNRDKDIPVGADTNISKLFELYNEKTNDANILIQKRHYLIGVGTDPEKWYDDWLDTFFFGLLGKIIKDKLSDDKSLRNFSGIITGSGGKERIEDAKDQLEEFLKVHSFSRVINVDVFGFSRGAALARHFINIIYNIPRVKVRFLGIYDTVGSFGLGGNDVNIGYALDVHSDRVETVRHYTAMHEYRSLFDLTSIKMLVKDYDQHESENSNKDEYRETKPLPSNMVERSFMGAHTDVGGGYGPEVIDKDKLKKTNEVSRIPLYVMVEEAIKCGVPLHTIDDFKTREPERYEKAFNITDDLQKLKNIRNDEIGYLIEFEQNKKMFFDKYIHDSRYFYESGDTFRDTFYHGVY